MKNTQQKSAIARRLDPLAILPVVLTLGVVLTSF